MKTQLNSIQLSQKRSPEFVSAESSTLRTMSSRVIHIRFAIILILLIYIGIEQVKKSE